MKYLWKNASPLFFIALVPIIFGVLGCSGSENSSETDQTTSDRDGRDGVLLEAGTEKLATWVNHWSNVGLTGAADAFKKTQTHAIDVLERPEVNPLPESESPLADLQLDNPEGKGVVDIYDYKVNINADGQFMYEPDAEVIYYKDNGMRERLLFIGPSGLFEEAAWIDASTLVVGGYFEGEKGFSPIIWVVSMDKGTYDVYETSFVAKEYARHAYIEKKLSGLDLAL